MPSLVHLEKDYQELFTDLHASGLWRDGKEISDVVSGKTPAEILALYRAKKEGQNFDLKAFFYEHFSKAPSRKTNYKSDTSKPVADHINQLWDILARQPEQVMFHSTLIQLPHPYIVPGGRFNEIYYWDSYFTMLGLAESGRLDMIEDMIDNFAWLIDEFGFIPNGNRSYYLGRSQPPFFSLMVALLAQEKEPSKKDKSNIVDELAMKKTYENYLPALEKEYGFWMEGIDRLEPGNTNYRRVVQIDHPIVMNRYYDNIHSPRAEMYSDDVELIKSKGEEGEETLLNIRAACESGWDFSSRWCSSPNDLASIETTGIIPIDLNCLLYNLETVLWIANRKSGNKDKSTYYRSLASNRKSAIQNFFWNEETQFYHDYNFVKGEQTESISAAAVFPLFFQISTADQAAAVAKRVEAELLKDGGLLTTTFESGQQWDAPNGWAPLQWMAIQGLRNYGFTELADKIKTRWVDLNTKVFKNTGKLMEKYNVVNINLPSGGGEYPVQDGFGWTNGVLLKLLSE